MQKQTNQPMRNFNGFQFTTKCFGLFVAVALLAIDFPSSSLFGQDDNKNPTQQNSTRKIRVEPSAQSQRIGSAVDWQPDFEAAVAKSKETGKPIFWYVPTLRGTFMDRKSEIDRYMMAGPFSWPNVIVALNERYIPIKIAPTQDQQEKYDLLPYKFIEPGFVILNPDGSEKLKTDRMTTLHVEWFRKLLTDNANRPLPNIPPSAASLKFSQGDFEGVLRDLPQSPNAPNRGCENDFLVGMALFRLGRHDEANQVWKELSEKYSEEPLAWKAAAEVQGIGPFVRGFEVHQELPAKVLKFDYQLAGSAAPAKTYTESQLWDNSTRFLMGMQNQDGGFKDSDYDFGGTDSLPNVHVAVTSIAGMALLRTLERKDGNPALRDRTVKAINNAINYVSNDDNINKADKDEILWAYAYRLRFLIRAKKQIATLNGIEPAMDHYIKQAVAGLESIQSSRGGWYHEYHNPFVTSTALMALHEAQSNGAIVDSKKVESGLESLGQDRFGNGAYPYSSSRGNAGGNKKEGSDRQIIASAGRMPLCELGLWYWGKSSDERLVNAIQTSLDGQATLEKARKYDDHTSTHAYGGFFFWYDMRARSEAISKISDPALRKKMAAQQREIILSLPEIDGCFVDSHELGRVYGTAMALLSLANVNDKN